MDKITNQTVFTTKRFFIKMLMEKVKPVIIVDKECESECREKKLKGGFFPENLDSQDSDAMNKINGF